MYTFLMLVEDTKGHESFTTHTTFQVSAFKCVSLGDVKPADTLRRIFCHSIHTHSLSPLACMKGYVFNETGFKGKIFPTVITFELFDSRVYKFM